MPRLTSVRAILTSFFFIGVLFNPSAWSAPKFSSELAKDVAQTYGFVFSQTHSLNMIGQHFPALKKRAHIAELAFSRQFQSSIETMDMFMTKHFKAEWPEIKDRYTDQIEASTDVSQLSESEASQFVDLVMARATGDIESPITETLLLFEPDYQEAPAKEFAAGHRVKYESDGSGKAKGIHFVIEHPKTWKAKLGNRPNVVQKFVSGNGRGSDMFMVIVKHLPSGFSEAVRPHHIAELSKPAELKDMIPDQSTLLDGGPLTIEGEPGYWMHYTSLVSRVRNTVRMETIAYSIFYRDKLIQLQGAVITEVNGEKINGSDFKRYEPLFNLMANSFVLPMKYR